jgi:hypothetical protein
VPPLPVVPNPLQGLCGSLTLLKVSGCPASAGSCGSPPPRPGLPLNVSVGLPLSRCSLSSLLGRRCNVLPLGSCVKVRSASPGRAGGQTTHTRAGRATGVGWRAARGQRAPPPRRSLRSVVIRMVFYWPGCVLPGTGGGAVLLSPDHPPWRRGYGGGWPLAAARGCRLLRRFFFLLRRRNVILAGPRQGQASLRSVRQRTLDMA